MQVQVTNNRLVAAINPPTNIVFIVPALIANIPPIKVNTTVVIQPSVLEVTAISPLEKPTSAKALCPPRNASLQF